MQRINRWEVTYARVNTAARERILTGTGTSSWRFCQLSNSNDNSYRQGDKSAEKLSQRVAGPSRQLNQIWHKTRQVIKTIK